MRKLILVVLFLASYLPSALLLREADNTVSGRRDGITLNDRNRDGVLGCREEGGMLFTVMALGWGIFMTTGWVRMSAKRAEQKSPQPTAP